ncbi:MAG: energy-coupling factor transporter transmembrane component T [Oscillospiraceae bacterium]
MNSKKLDPRTVILLVIVNSIVAVLVKSVTTAALSALLIFAFDMAYKVDVKGVLIKCKRLWQVVIFAAIMQSVFITQGQPLIKIFGVCLMTTHGVATGAIILLRLFAIMCGAAALSVYSQGEIIEALVRLKVPYEFAYMIIIGIKFLPTLKQEMQDSLIAIQLRGIELEKLKLSKKMKIYSYLLFPIESGTIVRAKDLSASMEMRGFRAFESRTSMLELKFSPKDAVAAAFFVSIQVLIVSWRGIF